MLQSKSCNLCVFWILQYKFVFFLLSPEKYDFNRKETIIALIACRHTQTHRSTQSWAFAIQNPRCNTSAIHTHAHRAKLIKSFYDWTWNEADESFCASATLLKNHLKLMTTFYDTFFMRWLLLLCIQTQSGKLWLAATDVRQKCVTSKDLYKFIKLKIERNVRKHIDESVRSFLRLFWLSSANLIELNMDLTIFFIRVLFIAVEWILFAKMKNSIEHRVYIENNFLFLHLFRSCCSHSKL